uniref:Glycosyltransferase-like protein LARGE (inferred by orthology to a C. elegans protein) n=1 Tax=Anisakis simplex TaxID=6269 RepID=A0A0M3JTP4_ANISI
LVTLLKSLLYHRRNAITLHLVVDDIAAKILPTLFRTWRLPSVEVLFYDSSAFVNRVSWIPNRHYSKEFGLLKLTLADILASNVRKVVVLDTDLLFVEDVSKLWQYWSLIAANSSHIFGLVENLSDWYLNNNNNNKSWYSSNRKPWPAWVNASFIFHVDMFLKMITLFYDSRNNNDENSKYVKNRGFNTGVMLMDLEKLRQMNWTYLWKEVANENLKEFGATQLADQDIINAVISKKPEMVHKLPCEWNFQMGYQSKQNLCAAKISELKVVHWNSPKKIRTQNPYAIFFRRHYQTFTQMDGNLLRADMIPCYNELKSSEIRSLYDEYDENEDGCAELRNARHIVYRTQLFIRAYEYEMYDVDVTLVTQLSIDRLLLLESLLSYWNGPISVAFYLSDLELIQLADYFNESNLFNHRKNVAIHAVFKEGIHYPINYLRNVALNASTTSHVFLVDVDFLPMPGLYCFHFDYFQIVIIIVMIKRLDLYILLRERLLKRTTYNPRTAFIIAAFESKLYRNIIVPNTKSNLLSFLDNGQIQIFRQDVWKKGHFATDYDFWRNTDFEYSVTWRTDYEPYVVVARNETPFYDTRFVGFGWNKVSHIMSMNAKGFDFIVLPNVFIVHQSHSSSFEITKYRTSTLYRRCMKALKGEFVRDLLKSSSVTHHNISYIH